ncbi:FCD domain-containing protein [Marinobacterium sediminicola]|uniref:Transcriptional regulator, GntR family n=1 Tax=Marinobacterium sediminicola TaxID=518898 RepID=A0ABY1S147_9GAMM|nr:FCD domain-containing protein [Marinobacterium sediminicola]ULG70096.1 FCD domain-containing protein [Marinobacterium sediminicola]SMR74914.1 transcriptional regulator, GntR family [Marinobacterium sediminicola]
MPNKQSCSTAQSIAHHLEKMIIDGSLAPDRKIPSERQLSSRLGVSRAIVREALHELHGRGMIETRHGKGSFVTCALPQLEESSPLMQAFSGHTRTLYDLFEVREQLEGQAAALAAERATEMDQVRITRAFEAMEAADPLSNANLDHAFHSAIVEASHNPILVHILSSLKELMLGSVQASVMNLNHRQAFKQQIDKHHRQIYHAVISRQARWARKAAMAHVRHVSEALRQIEEAEHHLIRHALDDATDDTPPISRSLQ